MTSPSRRKRPTTPPSTPPGTACDLRRARRGATGDVATGLPAPLFYDLPRAEPIWLPAGLLATLLTLAMALSASGGEVSDSGWTQAAASRAAVRPTLFEASPSARVVTSTAAGFGWGRAAAPAHAVHRGRVRLVAYDGHPVSGPARGSQRGSARLKSIVVERNGERRAYRVAQQEDADQDDLFRELEQGFGPAETPAETPGEAPDALPDVGVLPPMDDDTSPSDEQDMLRQPDVRDPFEAEDAIRPGELQDLGAEDLDTPGGEFEMMDDADIPPARADDLAEARKNCAEELAELKASSIADIDLSIRMEGQEGSDYPVECSIDDGTPFSERAWPQVVYMWKASALCHKPLYFEDVHLERYGHSWGPCLQPFVSGVHFFSRLPALPYCMGLTAPNECVYTLGHYRPGSCAPYMIEPIPFTWRAAAFEGAAWTGGVFLFP